MTFPRDPDWGYLFMRAMATVKQETDENERLRAALQEIAECPNEGPFLRQLARKTLVSDENDRERNG